VGAKATSGSWVGRPLPRLEDEALLRGEGRFIDDLDPVANARHAAVLRSPFAHARIARLDASAATELPGVVGILTGADVAGLSRPFPAGIESPIPQYAAAHETVRFVGEPVAVVVARDRYVAEDALELIDVDYEPLEPVLDSETAAETVACVSDRSFSYGDFDAALAQAALVVRESFRFPRWSCTPVECYGVVCDWNAAEGSLTAWANFQGPFTLHSVAAAALGLPGSKLRLITPPDSGGSFGVKAAVLGYVVLIGLASRALGDDDAARRWLERAAASELDPASGPTEAWYWRSLALAELGHADDARDLARRLLRAARRQAREEVRIDYFATSLPTFLVFDDDLGARNRTECRYLEGLALEALGRRAASRRAWQDTLARQPDHPGASARLREDRLAGPER